jgi:hypothetical protein
LEQFEHFTLLKAMMGMQYTFQKVAQLSQENKVLEAPPSIIDALHSKDTRISQFS